MTALLWFSMGLLTVLVIASARAWARDLGLAMRWWKWLALALWYGWCLLAIAVAMTLLGESESAAALRIFAPMALLALIGGVGLARVLLRGRRRSAG